MRALYDSLVLFPAEESGAAGCRLFAKTRTLYSVRLWGPLHPLWADRFTRGLSNVGISILNGFARQDSSDGFAVDGSPERGGLLYLEVRGPDRVGFLGSLLRTLSDLELVPREMWVATRDGEACDRFLLASSDGRLPTDEKRRVLEEALDTPARRS